MLSNTEEHWIRQETNRDVRTEPIPKRHLGMVMVARKHIKKIFHIPTGPEDESVASLH